MVTNYFDKLIQIPIGSPPSVLKKCAPTSLMLFIENSELETGDKDALRTAIASQLRESWKGKRVDKNYIANCGVKLPTALIPRLDTAERLAPLMTTSDRISGNPRLIKRFLNALSIRMTISAAQGVGVDEPVLAKLLLFERLAPKAASRSFMSQSMRIRTKAEAPCRVGRSRGGGQDYESWVRGMTTSFASGSHCPPPSQVKIFEVPCTSNANKLPITSADRLSSEAAALLQHC